MISSFALMITLFMLVSILLIGSGLFLKNTRFFSIVAILFLLFIHTYLFGNIRKIDKEFYVVYSAWREVLICYVTFLFFIQFIVIKHRIKVVLLSLMLLIGFGVVFGLSQKYPIVNVFVCARDILLPLIFFFGVSLFKIRFEESQSRQLIFILTLTAIACSVNAIWSYYTFDGTLSKIWVYDIYKDMDVGVGFADFNYIRDGKLRAIGFFSSPSEYSLSILFFLFIFTYYTIFSKGFRKIPFFLMLLFFGFACYVANIRTWVLTYFIGILFGCALLLFRRSNLKRTVFFFAIPLCFVAITFGYLVSTFGFLKDDSSAGRITQYISAVSIITGKPWGYGFGFIGPKAVIAPDSNILTFVYTFGLILVLVYIYLFVKLLISILKLSPDILSKANKKLHGKVLYISVMSYLSSFIYTSFFQYTISMSIYLMVFIIAGLFISNQNNLVKTYEFNSG